MDEDTLISYGDMVCAPETLVSMMAATAEVSVAIDTGFLDYWKARTKTISTILRRWGSTRMAGSAR